MQLVNAEAAQIYIGKSCYYAGNLDIFIMFNDCSRRQGLEDISEVKCREEN